MESTRRIVVDAVVEVCGTEESRLVDTATLQDLGIDSLDLLEIGMIVERELDTIVDAEDFDGVGTVGETVQVFDRVRASGDHG